MKQSFTAALLAVFAGAVMPTVVTAAEAMASGTFTEEQFERGQVLYERECASCHGVNLEGQVGWRDTKVDGMRLAPPHDKSGHTWHHPDELLYKLTKYGFEAMIGSEYKVSMPIYDGLLKY